MRTPVEQRDLIGTAVELRQRAEVLRASGRVVHVFKPRQLDDGRIAVTVILRRRTAEPSRRRPAVIAASVVTALLALAGTGYALYLHTAGLLATATRLAAGLFVLAAVWFVLGRVGACPGLHCPGCRHH